MGELIITCTVLLTVLGEATLKAAISVRPPWPHVPPNVLNALGTALPGANLRQTQQSGLVRVAAIAYRTSLFGAY